MKESHGRGNYRSLPTFEAALIQSWAYRSLRVHVEARLARYGLSMADWLLLGLISRQTGARLAELSKELQVEAPRVTLIMRRLEQLELAERVTERSDRRARTVRLTVKGKKLLTTLEPEIRGEMRTLLHEVSSEELEVYLNVLAKLARKLKN